MIRGLGAGGFELAFTAESSIVRPSASFAPGGVPALLGAGREIVVGDMMNARVARSTASCVSDSSIRRSKFTSLIFDTRRSVSKIPIAASITITPSTTASITSMSVNARRAAAPAAVDVAPRSSARVMLARIVFTCPLPIGGCSARRCSASAARRRRRASGRSGP